MKYVYSYEQLGGGLGYTIRNERGHLHSSYVQEADARAFCALFNAWPGLRDHTGDICHTVENNKLSIGGSYAGMASTL